MRQAQLIAPLSWPAIGGDESAVLAKELAGAEAATSIALHIIGRALRPNGDPTDGAQRRRQRRPHAAGGGHGPDGNI
jgi:hypothetical protein